jgi:hypothetical protein
VGPSKRKEEKEIKIKKSAKFLGRLEDLTKQPKKDINRHQGTHSYHSLVEIIPLSILRTFALGLAQIQGSEIQEKKFDGNEHNFLVRYWNYKLLSSLESLLQWLCDPILKMG